MARQRPNERADETEEITGVDASIDQAEVGDAGNGADPFGGDLAGGLPRPIEDPPDEPEDIMPDHIGRFPRELNQAGEVPREPEVTAQPDEMPPFDTSDLP